MIDMSKIIPPPDREATEREVHSLFTNGDLSNLARLLQKDQSLISKAYNPYSTEKNNPVYQFILNLWAMDVVSDSLAGEVLNIVLREREKWLPARASADCPARLTHNIVREFGEFIEAELCDKNFEIQVKEIIDVINAAEKKKADIIAKKNRDYFGVAS